MSLAKVVHFCPSLETWQHEHRVVLLLESIGAHVGYPLPISPQQFQPFGQFPALDVSLPFRPTFLEKTQSPCSQCLEFSRRDPTVPIKHTDFHHITTPGFRKICCHVPCCLSSGLTSAPLGHPPLLNVGLKWRWLCLECTCTSFRAFANERSLLVLRNHRLMEVITFKPVLKSWRNRQQSANWQLSSDTLQPLHRSFSWHPPRPQKTWPSPFAAHRLTKWPLPF